MKLQKKLFFLVREAGASAAFLAVSLARIRHAFYRVARMDARPVVVMGNGPSSADSIRQLMKVRGKVAVVCVNDYYQSDSFQEVRPDAYVIADPHYWIPGTEEWHARPLIEGFSKISWPIDFFIPSEAAPFIRRGLGANRNITLYPYNRMTAWGFPSVRHLGYRLGLGMPRPQNVLVAALFLALKGGARTVYMGGAEHLWHETLKLSEDNKLYVSHGSTGAEGAKLVPFYKVLGGELWTVPDLFEAWSLVHRSYHELEEWSRSLGATIVNFTPTTFIDAFARARPEAVVAGLEAGGAADAPTAS